MFLHSIFFNCTMAWPGSSSIERCYTVFFRRCISKRFKRERTTQFYYSFLTSNSFFLMNVTTIRWMNILKYIHRNVHDFIVRQCSNLSFYSCLTTVDGECWIFNEKLVETKKKIERTKKNVCSELSKKIENNPTVRKIS